MAEPFVQYLKQRYPRGNVHLEEQLASLKRKLNDIEFSSCDEEELIQSANQIEKKLRKNANNAYKCKYCPKAYSLIRNCVRHERTHEQAHKCNRCDVSFLRRDLLKKHFRKFHNINNDTSGLTTCSCCHCDMQFQTYPELYVHARRKRTATY